MAKHWLAFDYKSRAEDCVDDAIDEINDALKEHKLRIDVTDYCEEHENEEDETGECELCNYKDDYSVYVFKVEKSDDKV